MSDRVCDKCGKKKPLLGGKSRVYSANERLHWSRLFRKCLGLEPIGPVAAAVAYRRRQHKAHRGIKASAS